MKNLQVRIKRPPNGTCSPDDFELFEGESPAPGKGEMLCRSRWLSLDPLHGAHPGGARSAAGHVLPAQAICEVVDSRNEVFNAGDVVVMEAGLQSYCVSGGLSVRRARTGGAPLSAALSIMGDPGFTAYYGLLELARIRQGETVLVSGAGSPVGATAGQIARIRGCKVIGIAANHEQSQWCMKDAHFNACLDASSEPLEQRLRQLAPKGIDVFFDASGGAIFARVIGGEHLSPAGRVVRSISNGATQTRTGGQELHVDLRAHEHRREAFLKDAIAWHAEGHLRYREDIVEGLHNAPSHYCRVVRGESFGRALVKN